jgi:hypothetical protein
MTLAREFEWVIPGSNGILATLDEFGVVNFYVQASVDSPIRGTEFFNRMVDEFGSEITAIHGVWRKGPSNLPSINIDKVNELTGKGVQVSEAIRGAWTVTRAAKKGFYNVRLLHQPEGTAGNYTKIDVWIEK